MRVNKTYKSRLAENRHMSMRTVANVQLKYKRIPQNWETLRSTNRKTRDLVRENEQTTHEIKQNMHT